MFNGKLVPIIIKHAIINKNNLNLMNYFKQTKVEDNRNKNGKLVPINIKHAILNKNNLNLMNYFKKTKVEDNIVKKSHNL